MSTSKPSELAADRSPGSIATACSRSDRSAPAPIPGPPVYGRGGDRPTVTDANLLLGRLSLARIAGRRHGARPGLFPKPPIGPIADRLGFFTTADGAWRTGHRRRQYGAHDPDDFGRARPMIRGISFSCPFGGAGPLHARDRLSQPWHDGNDSCRPRPVSSAPRGLLVSDLKEDFVASRRFDVDGSGMETLAEALTELQSRAARWFEAEKRSGRQPSRRIDRGRTLCRPEFRTRGPGPQRAPQLSRRRFPTAPKCNPGSARRMRPPTATPARPIPWKIVNVRLSASARLFLETAPPRNSDAPVRPGPARRTSGLFFRRTGGCNRHLRPSGPHTRPVHRRSGDHRTTGHDHSGLSRRHRRGHTGRAPDHHD